MSVNKDCSSELSTLSRTGSRGFTLIELLVVIAIITLLAALLFPVFATAQENSRQSSTMTHLEQIQSALALYKLDNHSYPQVLFGYAVAGKPMSDSFDIAQAGAEYGVGSLFPTYVNDYHVFESNDNPVDNNLTQTVNLTSLELDTSVTPQVLKPISRSFYVMDGFDVSPQLAALGTKNAFINGTTPASLMYVLRYQRDWTSIQQLTTTVGTVTTPTTYDQDPYFTHYLHQLRWQNPPGDTYVTSTTYHVPNGNKVIVLFESGSVAKIDPTQLGGYDDSTSCANLASAASTEPCTLDQNKDNPAKFWQIANTQ